MDLLTALAAVGLAAGFVGWKVWGLVRPGARTSGCSCSSAKKGCIGCPLTKP